MLIHTIKADLAEGLEPVGSLRLFMDASPSGVFPRPLHLGDLVQQRPLFRCQRPVQARADLIDVCRLVGPQNGSADLIVI